MLDIYLDLDGTLLDVSERYYRIYQDIMTSLQQPILTKDRYWEYKRSKVPESQIVALTAIDHSVFPIYSEIRKRLLEDPRYLDFDRLVLSSLNQILANLSKSCCLYLVTMRKKRVTLLNQLKKLNLYCYFQDILSPSSELPSDAPSWEIKANLICSRGKPRPGIIVGDTEADILAGKELGLGTYAVLSGLRDRRFLVELDPDVIIYDISELSLQLQQRKNSH
jgi:phosphoglycolate phosphatase-like HAD superfamily hydrolase